MPKPAFIDRAMRLLKTDVRFPRPRFTLRTLFVVTTLLAIPMAFLGWQYRIVQNRKAMRTEIEQAGGYVESIWPAVPWYRRMFGDEEIAEFAVPNSMEGRAAVEILEAFPEARLKFFDAYEASRRRRQAKEK